MSPRVISLGVEVAKAMTEAGLMGLMTTMSVGELKERVENAVDPQDGGE